MMEPDEQGGTASIGPGDRGPGGRASPGTAPPGAHAAGGHGESAGDFIGPYKLLEVIGEGGFGTVFLAERREPMVQRVALKVIKPGMDSRAVLARFEQERQALAVMSHPNVARVFDGGVTPRGRPYFVMEHVRGEPITTYCDRQTLTLRDRLELFIPVCEAVQHAHHKGIIHRDLKPSNILVTVDGGRATPKVIDFGVAKAVTGTLAGQSIFTETGQLIGTPEYMSPEQAEMGATDIDTRTDVYSLGVVLYELLAGALPFTAAQLRSAGYGEVQRIIREVDPPTPSQRLSAIAGAGPGRSGSGPAPGANPFAIPGPLPPPVTAAGIATHRRTEPGPLIHELRRELDWVPLKAMRKSRTERYDTPADLARDVRRYLDGEALEAGPESVEYRVRKFVRRHRGPVTAGLAVLGVLLLGVLGTSWGFVTAARRAEGERLAKVEAEEGRTLAETRTAEAQAARAAEVTTRERAEYQAYVANIELAGAAMEARQGDRLRARLDACPERLRGWEWRWLDANSDCSLAVLRLHEKGISSAAYSPDGKRIVTASFDNTARVWDTASKAMLLELKGHTGGVMCAAFSPDGKRIVTGSYDSTTRVWDAATGAEALKLKAGMVLSAAFSPDGTRIVTGSGESGRVWDAATGASLLELNSHPGWVRAAFSPDGMRIVTGSMDKTARVWDAATGTVLLELKGHTKDACSAAFSPDGKRIVTASDDRTARLWDAATGASILELKGHSDGLVCATFSPDGKRIVTGSLDKTARVWDSTTGAGLLELRGHGVMVASAAFSPDGTRILTGGAIDNTVRIWDATMEQGPIHLSSPVAGTGTGVFSPDGTRIVTASPDGAARVWDAATGAALLELTGQTGSITPDAFSPVGTWMSTAFSPDGGLIFTASGNGTSRVWDAASGAVVREGKAPPGGALVVAFSPDWTRSVAASPRGTARVRDSATGAELFELKGDSVDLRVAVFSPDRARIVTVSSRNTVLVWDGATGGNLAELKGHSGQVFSVAFSPDGARIATGATDGSARVWDATSGAALLELKGQLNLVFSVAFSPDGTRIVTASEKAAHVWDATTGAGLIDLTGHPDWVNSAAFTADGTRIVTASQDGTTRVWDTVPYRERHAALAARRAAAAEMAGRVAPRIAAGEDLDGIVKSVLADRSLSEPQRTGALAAVMAERDRRSAPDRARAAETRVRATEAWALNAQTWPVASSPNSSPAAIAHALEQSLRAAALAPDAANMNNTLGVLQYRAGEYEAALATLGRSAALRAAKGTASAADLAFTAMAQHRLGRTAVAAATLASLRRLLAEGPGANPEEAQVFLCEAEDLIGADGPAGAGGRAEK